MLLTLSRRERILIAAMLLALAGYAVVALVHRPIASSLAEARSRLETVENDLLKAENALAREGDLAERTARVREREEAIEALVPGQHAASLFVHYLSRSEQAAGVSVRAIKATKMEQVGDLLHLQLEMQATGTFLSHVLFHQNLEAVPLFFDVGGWSLDSQRDQAIAQALDLYGQGQQRRALATLKGHPELAGVYQVTVYFRPEKAAPGTEGLGYGEAGRPDPFVRNLIDEFMAEVHLRYPEKSADGGQGEPAEWPAAGEDWEPVQLG